MSGSILPCMDNQVLYHIFLLGLDYYRSESWYVLLADEETSKNHSKIREVATIKANTSSEIHTVKTSSEIHRNVVELKWELVDERACVI